MKAKTILKLDKKPRVNKGFTIFLGIFALANIPILIIGVINARLDIVLPFVLAVWLMEALVFWLSLE